MSKRQKTSAASTTTRRAKRPIDKKLTNVSLTNIVAAKQEVDLYAAATFPGTITGVRWSLTVRKTGGTAVTKGNMAWSIVIVPAGTTTSTMTLANAGSLYDPEQNVIAFGRFSLWDSATNNDAMQFEGSTKAMRKLKAGDKLVLNTFGTATERCDIDGTVQFFYKT